MGTSCKSSFKPFTAIPSLNHSKAGSISASFLRGWAESSFLNLPSWSLESCKLWVHSIRPFSCRTGSRMLHLLRRAAFRHGLYVSWLFDAMFVWRRLGCVDVKQRHKDRERQADRLAGRLTDGRTNIAQITSNHCNFSDPDSSDSD